MGFAERRAEGTWARRFGRQSIQRAGCLFLPVTRLACLVEPLAIHLDPTEPSGDMDYTFSLRGNAATESGNAGIGIVLGERCPSVKVFGLSLARGGHQTMKRSISIYH
jgi:hypothetical protein